ncbi:hypothetical protein AB0284_05725 [Pseudarthrobacter phenanthrenivorans]|uniref:hypothetical protein n=1 Tax=Pseudarthrobacter phenanthrenivorans TaxID=361575 RepID=UPI00344BBBA7
MQRILGWVAGAAIVTIVFATLYLTLQHIGRRSVNDALAAAVDAQIQQIGSDPETGPRLELTQESGTFLMVYGQDNKPIFTTVTLHGEVPNLPTGVLDTTRATGADEVTWQPETGLRMAIVARQTAGKVVVAGQSLTRFETTDKSTQLIVAAGWLTSMLVLAAAYAVTAFRSRRHPNLGNVWGVSASPS